MKDYISINKETFDLLAEEYNTRWKDDLIHELNVLEPFIKRLKKIYHLQIKILDVGCGAGLESFIFSQNGFFVRGVDISPKMAAHAQQNVPSASITTGDFMQEEFKEKFSGVCMASFLHLYPKKDVPPILNKAKSLLLPSGLLFVSTTRSKFSQEGYFEKEDYIKRLKRFRKFWTREELLEILEQNGFKILTAYDDYNRKRKKEWLNVIAQKC